MRSAPVRFAVLALGLHVLGLSAIWQGKAYEGGMAGPTVSDSGPSAVVVAGIHFAKPAQEIRAPAHPLKESDTQERGADRKTSDTSYSRASDTGKAATVRPTARQLQEYLAAGSLTRLPSPVTSIDLDMDEIREVAAPGLVNLTILINDDGTVADVLSMTENDSLQAFSQRVSEVFRRARFNPGELNGAAVKARLELSIVSESIQAL